MNEFMDTFMSQIYVIHLPQVRQCAYEDTVPALRLLMV